MRVLVALDMSEIGESTARAMETWARTGTMEVHLLSVIHPDEVHSRAERSSSAEFLEPEGTEPGHIPAIGGDQYGDLRAAVGDQRPMTVEYRGQALARARSEREDYLRQVAARDLAGAGASIHVDFSDRTAEAILEAAKAVGADAIAMGTHGRSGIRHALVGSVAEEVMRQSPVPVVLIGPQAHAARSTGSPASA